MAADAPQTPMMAQYRRIKGELPRDALLLFRLGDFYEMFFEDARIGARILGLALTRRNGVPMCGLPYHAASAYVGRLLNAGFKVALCDQIEEAKPGKLVKREITAILSPGTHWDERLLPQEQNHFLAAVYADAQGYGLAVVDLSTAEFRVTEVEDELALKTELERLRPAEIIYPAEAQHLASILLDPPAGAGAKGTEGLSANQPRMPGRSARVGWVLNPYEDWAFSPETAQFTLRDHFRVATLDGFGLRGRARAIAAAGAALHYLSQHLRRDVRHLTRLLYYHRGDHLVLDSTTLRHLEVLEPMQRDAPTTACLYGVLNRSVTPMGARRLRDWLSQPLATREGILRRQEAIQAFLDHPAELESFRHQLAEVRDLERTLSRLSSGSGNARDLVALRLALEQMPALRELLESLSPAASPELSLPPLTEAPKANPALLLRDLARQIADFPDLVALIRGAIVDDPPLSVREGGMIRDGFEPTLDELRRAMREGKEWIARYQAEEIQRTGIASLKVRYNSVFGYYIEVTKANLDRVPAHYQRKQTIANGERFITPELKEIEAKILGAEERSLKLEYELFQSVRERVLAHLESLQQTAAALAAADALASLAETARLHQYCRPHIGDEGVLEIRDGRHPVLEQAMLDKRFVPNDTWLASGPAAAGPSTSDAAASLSSAGAFPQPPQIALITGPNMAGKSTYIRQVALIVLLAHVGSFVPARSARVDLIDRLFTRIGAADDLTRGQSTFMVEMTETANILHHATARSLIVLDEVGRGTSTFDGLSLAWSIIEYIHNQIGAKTLFATHYHELTELAARLPRLQNYNVAVREWRDQIVFLYKIVEGATDKSYGIHVARLAGVPQAVLDRAKIILANLEAAELNPDGTPQTGSRAKREREKLRQLAPPDQLDLFG
ncbi:MAG: DNA mismatch repair protein MutS [Verrucomicrobiota bacterium]|nr:DNA mismatch repair protein MutS [Limisphaera sp.]MDW8382829.1 DNA mismatch repair protein MutS [Verrucomicrobiota bacterium]